MRNTSININSRLMKMEGLVHPVTAAKAMGMRVVDKTVAFDSNSDVPLLAEYSIYYHLSGGKCHFQRALAGDLTLNEAERKLLQRYEKSFSSVWEVRALRPELWEIDLQDMLGQRRMVTIIDRSLSHTSAPGIWIHARLVPHDGFVATSGVALPLFAPTSEENRELDDDVRTAILRHCRGALRNPGKRTLNHALFYVCRKLQQRFGPSMLYD